MRRLFANANYDFINSRRKAYLASLVAVIISVAAIVFWQVREGSWVNYGVDFTGGSIMFVEISGDDVNETEVRNVAQTAVPGSIIAGFGEGNAYNIRTPNTGVGAATAPSDHVLEELRERFGADNVVLDRVEAVSAKVGSELQTRALVAILLSLVATLIYIAFRFEWRFGVAAVVSTAHDIVFTLGFIALLRIEVSLTTVAAVLTIVGYSLNDTIVIFDRIRENLASSKRADFISTMNRAINETLPRTILTTGTTLVTLLALFLFGGGVIRDFALILIVGIVLGTYSSVFVASPVLYEVEKRWPRQVKTPRRSRPAPTARPTRV